MRRVDLLYGSAVGVDTDEHDLGPVVELTLRAVAELGQLDLGAADVQWPLDAAKGELRLTLWATPEQARELRDELTRALD